MTIKEAHEMLDKEYYKACSKEYISDPLMTAAGVVFEALEAEHSNRREVGKKERKIEYDDFDRSGYEWR